MTEDRDRLLFELGSRLASPAVREIVALAVPLLDREFASLDDLEKRLALHESRARDVDRLEASWRAQRSSLEALKERVALLRDQRRPALRSLATLAFDQWRAAGSEADFATAFQRLTDLREQADTARAELDALAGRATENGDSGPAPGFFARLGSAIGRVSRRLALNSRLRTLRDEFDLASETVGERLLDLPPNGSLWRDPALQAVAESQRTADRQIQQAEDEILDAERAFDRFARDVEARGVERLRFGVARRRLDRDARLDAEARRNRLRRIGRLFVELPGQMDLNDDRAMQLAEQLRTAVEQPSQENPTSA